MRAEAKLHDSTESSYLSLLDIAKHGVRTIIHSLGARDKLSLVTFNNRANVIFPPMLMNRAGQRKARQRLEELVPSGGTNIWEGLRAGLQALRSSEEDGIFDHVMLLTDGYTSHAESVIGNLKQHMAKNRMPCSISAFGFGYRLDSEMLASIAEFGDGYYSFIPDAGFIGTVFVNFISNVLVTMARAAYINIEAGLGAEVLVHEFMCYKVAERAGYTAVKVGNLQYGQTKDILVPLKIEGAGGVLRANGQFFISEDRIDPRSLTSVELDLGVVPDLEAPCFVERNRCRVLFVHRIPRIMSLAASDFHECSGHISELASILRTSPGAGDEAVQALLADITGQVSEAFSRNDWYEKWGIHYLLSLRFAHTLQQCNNFKDPGVQVYGGVLFQTVRDQADDNLNELPPPMPSRSPAPSVSAATKYPNAAAAPVVVCMATYNNPCGA
eukprot:TRINITY_DN21799_c0_g1_i1.p1 TRINITY_DN21799_c0_g1~~TRINITY_DN21799_c0_g1_i1.p1  ORF type:complete len:493 (+),score=64.97 TRINITY_DN21799_c0_g1_i1:155-1480(+)